MSFIGGFIGRTPIVEQYLVQLPAPIEAPLSYTTAAAITAAIAAVVDHATSALSRLPEQFKPR